MESMSPCTSRYRAIMVFKEFCIVLLTRFDNGSWFDQKKFLIVTMEQAVSRGLFADQTKFLIVSTETPDNIVFDSDKAVQKKLLNTRSAIAASRGLCLSQS